MARYSSLKRGFSNCAVVAAIVLLPATSASAQPPNGIPAGEMPWQVAAMFTVNWVLAAFAVAILSRPTKRTEKPKKAVDEEAA
ncbi:MAG TPA: hypothetical protein VHC22_08435 [Pirellulales bacterium]|nr:hypothetical protein [Pirellulales bacterium]